MSERSMRRARERQVEREARRAHRLGRRSKATLGIGTALGATVLFAPAAEAATYTVTNLDDAGPGSLREALYDAEGTAAADTIVFQSGLSGTIDLASLLPVNDYSVTIQGPGASVITVDGNDSKLIFDVYSFNAPGQQVTISGLTLTNGSGGSLGGALYQGAFVGYAPSLTLDGVVVSDSYTASNGGAIKSNAGDLTITNSTISGNDADQAGGGVYSDEGSLSITNTTISNNSAGDSGGGVFVQDTAGDQATEVVIRDSVLSGNDAGADSEDGGGISLDDPDGATVIERSTVSGNTATDNGGGIYTNSGIDASLTIRESTVSGNSASNNPYNPLSSDGGGIGIDDFDYSVTIENTTISGNSTSGSGGGIFGDTDNSTDSELQIRNSTIASNSAVDVGGGVYRESAFVGGGVYSSGDVTLSSTIVADNTAPTGPDLGEDPDINTGSGAFVLGFSLIESASGATTSENPAGSNLLGVDSLLGPLTDNGGPTQTHLPAANSPALDGGVANGLATDQRGEPRTFDASNIANKAGSDATDIGATELSATGACKGKAATVLFAPGQPITGSAGNDVIVGTDQKDKVNAAAGKDTVCAGKGNDKVKGGAGKDKLFGEKGKDKLTGQAGADKLAGAGGNDTLKGNGGKDKLKGGPGKDKLRGGPGKDKLSGGGGKDSEVQ